VEIHCFCSKAVIMSTSAISPAVPTAASPAVQVKSPPAGQSASAAAAVSAATAALQEATETSAQTTKEAAGGDRQAQKLLKTEAAAVAARSGAPINKAAGSSTGSRIDVKA